MAQLGKGRALWFDACFAPARATFSVRRGDSEIARLSWRQTLVGNGFWSNAR